MTDEFIKTLRSKIKPIWIFAFSSAFIAGLLAHLYRMTNWLPNWDSLVFREDHQHMEALGRWFLAFAAKISTAFEVPWLNGVLAIFYIALAAVFICEIFGIKSRLCAALTGAVAVTFPAVTSTLTYCYVADAYALSFLLTCIAVLLLTKKRIGPSVFGVLLLSVSMGIYQAYITTAIALLTAYLILGVIKGDKTSASLKKALKYIICGVAAFAVYYAVQSLVMALTNITASDYQGFSSAFSFKNFSFSTAVPAAFYTFFKFFIDFDSGFNLYSATNIVFFVFLAAGYLYAIIKNVRRSGLILVFIYIISIPIGCDFLYFANADLDYHTLMKMSYFIVYIYLILLYENADFKNIRINAVKTWAVFIICSAMVFCNIRIANIAYHKLQMAFEKSYGILIRISDRIESLDGYENATKILVVGSLKNSEAYSVMIPPEITGSTNGLILRHDDESVNQSVMTSALNDYCNMNLKFLSGKEAAALKNTKLVKSMPLWPKQGSVAIYKDTVILKLSEE